RPFSTSAALHQRPRPFPPRRSSDLDLVAANLFLTVQLHQAHADHGQHLAADRDVRAPFVEEAILHGDALDLRPDPRRIAYQQARSEEHTSELQSREKLVCRLQLEKT